MTTGVPIYLVSACTTGEEFVAAFRRYADRGSVFIPIADPIPSGRRGRFALTLSTGVVMIDGEGEVISSARTPSVLHGRIGMTIRFGELDDDSKTVLIELEKARLVAKPAAPSVAQRNATIPAAPRPVPPAPSVRVDAATTLAETVAIGDLESLASSAPPKPGGPKFVMPAVLPVGAPRPKTPSSPPELRPKSTTTPPPPGTPVVRTSPTKEMPPISSPRPKAPSLPPAMPTLAPLKEKSGPTVAPPGPLSATQTAIKAPPGSASETMPAMPQATDPPPGGFSATMPAVSIADLKPPEARVPLHTALANASAEINAPRTSLMDAPPTVQMPAQMMAAVVPNLTPTGMDAVEPSPSAEMAAVAPPAPTTKPGMTAVAPPSPPPPVTPQGITVVRPPISETPTQVAAVAPPAKPTPFGPASTTQIGGAASPRLPSSPIIPISETPTEFAAVPPPPTPNPTKPMPVAVEAAAPVVSTRPTREDAAGGPVGSRGDKRDDDAVRAAAGELFGSGDATKAPDDTARSRQDSAGPPVVDARPTRKDPMQAIMDAARTRRDSVSPVPTREDPPALIAAARAMRDSQVDEVTNVMSIPEISKRPALEDPLVGRATLEDAVVVSRPTPDDAVLVSRPTRDDAVVVARPTRDEPTSPTPVRIAAVARREDPTPTRPSRPGERAATPPVRPTPLPALKPQAPIVAAEVHKILENSPDLDEKTDLTAMPLVPDEPMMIAHARRHTVIGVAVTPAGLPVMPAMKPATTRDPAIPESVDIERSAPAEIISAAPLADAAAKLPTVEEATPSGDWTITPGADGPTLEPRAQVPERPQGPLKPRLTGDWTIQLDSDSPDGWSEPSRPDIARPQLPPVVKIEKPMKPRAENPPELAAVSRSIVVDAVRAAEAAHVISEEPKIQVDPTLMGAPIVVDDEPPPPAFVPPQTFVASRIATPIPGTLTAPPGLDSMIPTGQMAIATPIDTPMPTPVPGAFPVTAPSPSELAAMMVPPPPQNRMLTDGGVGFFRDSGEIANLSSTDAYATGDSTSLLEVQRRRRIIVIAVSAAVVLAIGIVLVIALAGGSGKKADEPSVNPPPIAMDAGSDPRAVATDAAVEAPPKVTDAAMVAPSKQECFVDIATVPAGADVQLGKDVIGTTPVKLPLPCGEEVKLTVKKPRFGNVVKVVTPTEDGAPVRITLQKLQFSVKLSSQPTGASISLNGQAGVAMTPTTMKLNAFELSTITFTRDGFAPETFKVTPKQNNQTVHAQLKRKR